MTAAEESSVFGGPRSGPAAALRGGPSWRVVAGQECRDLWSTGRAPVLLFAFSLLMSVVTYLAASNQALNFLEQREAVTLALQIAIVVGVLVTVVTSADAISGERERGTLENLLLTPVPRLAIVIGKLSAALCLWFATFLVTLPYVWVLGRGVSVVATAYLLGLLVGTLLAVGLAALGLLISAVSSSNRISVSVSLFLLIALSAPTQLPTMPQGWFGDLLGRVNPVGAAMHYINAVLVSGHGWTDDLSYLTSPLLLAIGSGGALLAAGSRVVRLQPGVS
jgi:ABC-2 type transport system permease protein